MGWKEEQDARAKQAADEAAARSRDPGAMGNIEVARRNAGITDPADIPGTWQNQQREIARFNEAQAAARARDPGAMGRTDAAELAGKRATNPAIAPAPAPPPRPAAQQQPAATTPQPAPQQVAPPRNQIQTLLSMPGKGFTKSEREWLKQLVTAINTARAIQGRNVQLTESPGGGTLIGASDCQPCA